MRLLEQAGELSELFDLVDTLTLHVENEHASMRCPAGCSACCSQLPLVTFPEWARILRYLHEHYSEGARRLIVRRAERLFDDAGSAMPQWMGLAHLDFEYGDAATRIDAMFENEATPCPLVFEGRCSVYPERPLVCRAYGRMMRTEDDSLYCEPILGQLRARRGGVEEVELPVYVHYQEKSYQLAGDGAYFAPLPVWILSHRTTDGDLPAEARHIDGEPGWPVLDVAWGFADAFAAQDGRVSDG